MAAATLSPQSHSTFEEHMIKNVPASLPLLRAITFASCLIAYGALAATPAQSPTTAAAAQPKLVVVLVVDGLPNEQVQRYRDQFGQGGLRRLLDQGASF